MTAPSNAIELRNLTKTFPGFTLGPLNLEIPQGYVTGFIGANGSGKTTTIKAILGMVRPDSGDVIAPPHAELAVVLDSPFYELDWTVMDVARVIAPFYPDWSQSQFKALLSRFGLPEERKVRELSRGMGMKLQLALALARTAEVLLLDEPTSGLDPLARSEFLDLLADYMLDERRTVLFSTHITSDLERIADYLAILNQGQLLISGPRDEVLGRYQLVRGGGRPPAELTTFGLRTHDSGWDALILSQQASLLSRDDVAQEPTLEDIAVRLAKGGRV